MSARWPRPLFYLVLFLALALDQTTKSRVASTFYLGESRTVIPGFFSLTYGQNTGVAFGMFKGEGLLVGLCIAAIALMALIYSRNLNWTGWEPNLVGGFLCGGALGNLIDRLRQGYVVDFFDVHVGAHQWPVFNVADSLICISVAWIVLRQFTGGEAKTTS
jgi:signal peptidase II